MEKITLRESQIVCLDILLAFDAFCRKHGLSYCLCGGTLLGAVRHKGFIPWDDDLDIFMARPDYERMIELSRTETIRADLEFACWKNGKFMRPFSRIYKTDTRAERRFVKDGQNLWIDVLPVDGMPEDRASWAKMYKRLSILDKFNVVTRARFAAGPNWKVRLKRTVSWPIAMLVGSRNWCRLMEHIGTKQDFAASTYVGCITAGRYGPGEGMPREGFLARTEISFEGYSFPAPACWHEYLSGIYGDYMTPPKRAKYNQHMLTVQADSADMRRIRATYASLLDATGQNNP